MKRLAGIALACAFFAGTAAAARADEPVASIGITLDPIIGGVHESYNDRINLPPIPVPLLEASAHFSNFELTGYGLPPTIAIPYTDAIQGPTRLRLTILDGTFRVWDNGNHFAIGIGETIYNQTTHYAIADFFATSGGEQQYSRLVGAHYEIAARFPFVKGALETSLRYAPVMLGTQVSTYENGTPSRFDHERGQQVDGNVRYVRHVGRHTDMIIGMRYVNFTAAYDVPLKPLSDRNAALLPAFGYRWHP